MEATTIEVTINNVDMPIFQSLFKKYKVKTKILDTPKKTFPIEKSEPNEETHKAFMEMNQKRKSTKGYDNVDLMIKDILEENE